MNYEEAFDKFQRVEQNATRGFNLAMCDENKFLCTRLKVFAQVGRKETLSR